MEVFEVRLSNSKPTITCPQTSQGNFFSLTSWLRLMRMEAESKANFMDVNKPQNSFQWIPNVLKLKKKF